MPMVIASVTASIGAILTQVSTITAVWYNNKCSRKAAWIPIVAVTLFLGVAGIPRAIFGRRIIPERAICQADRWVWIANDTIFKLGSLAVAIVSVLTFVLLVLMIKNSGSSSNASRSAREKTINRALSINCILYTVFGLLHYLLIFLPPKVENLFVTPSILLGLSQLLSSLGVASRALTYLLLPSMREALVKTFKGKNKRK